MLGDVLSELSPTTDHQVVVFEENQGPILGLSPLLIDRLYR